ncbi:MAG: SDR family oxidoreductase [Pseudomonadota bacterium]
MAMRLEGKTALVTGGRGGIGRAICDRFRAEGARVFACDLDPGGSFADGANGPNDGDGARDFIPLDVTDEAAHQAAIARVADSVGHLDILVTAAGIELEKTIEETTLDEWNQSFAVNVTGTFLAAKHALPLLRASGAETKSIVTFGSYDGFIADPGLAAYCATKGAVHALTRAMAVDHGPDGIRVNAICPGYVDTPMLEGFFEGDGAGSGGASRTKKEAMARGVHPLGTFGRPTDVANLALWLASDEARYASGQLWVLDGALTAQVQQMTV